MKKLILMLLAAPVWTYSQQAITGCNQLKELTAYSYPRNTTDQYKIIRTFDREVVYNMKTGDSTTYAIIWDNDCRYFTSILSSTKISSAAQLETLQKQRLAYELLSVTKEYYVYNMYKEQVNPGDVVKREMITDTGWLKPLAKPRNYEVFKLLTEKPAQLKQHFNDTSSYAIVYLYRLDKVVGRSNDYDVYFENDFMFRAQSKSKIAYKVYRTGPTMIHAKAGNVESSVLVNIEFGKKYYFQCLIQSNPPDLIPEIRLEENTDGQIWFNTL